MKRIVLFGDSLTQYGHGCERAFTLGAPGWGDRLKEMYARRADVLNRGCTQYNTRAALLTNLVPELDYSLVGSPDEVLFATVWFGANDACDPLMDKAKHVPVKEYEKNLRSIVNRVHMLTSHIVLITPPPINEEWYQRWRLPQVNNDMNLAGDRKNATIEEYAAICRKVAADCRIPCIDLFSVFPEVADWTKILVTEEDGLHLSGPGDKLVFDALVQTIAKSWPAIVVHPCPITRNFSNSGSSATSLPPHLPFWDKVDIRNYREQLGDIAKSVNEADDEEDNREVWLCRPAMVLLGDSITQQGYGSPSWCQSDDVATEAGWGDLLAARYARRIDVYNRGLAGYNSKWCLAAFESMFPTTDKRVFSVELVTIFFGANDAADFALNPAQHVPLNEFESNIEELVRRCQTDWDARRIVIIGCPPIDKDKYLAWRRNRTGNETKPEEQLMDRTIDVARNYSLAAEKVAKKQKVPFVNAFDTFGSQFADCLSDGLHLTPKGNRILGLKLVEVLDERWPELKCTVDPLRKKYGFQGSICHAFAPEQPWFSDIIFEEELHQTEAEDHQEEKETSQVASNQGKTLHKRVKL